MSHPYVDEGFNSEERAILLRYFTNVDRPVFAVHSLPEIVKGALFARYSRTAKSLRRLFLDEFYQGEGDLGLHGTEIGAKKAAELYDRIFIEFGDDSVAQLGGAHLAVEQGSNILTKQLEWGRLAAYLEQSTRYVPYDDKPGGRYRWYREPAIMASAHARAYEEAMDGIFDLYAAALPKAIEGFKARFPQAPEDPDRVYKMTIRAKALDSLRGMLPAATVSNTGIYASGQAFENMIMRMRASSLAEVRATADAMLEELNHVIPVFLQRLDQPNRGGAWVDYLRQTAAGVGDVARELLGEEKPEDRPAVTLLDFDPDAEEKLVSSILYSSTDLPEDQLRVRVARMSTEERARVIAASIGERGNRRHKPGRGWELPMYRFDVLCDYGAFRDLQRHRMLTMEWQDLTPRHGYAFVQELDEIGLGGTFREAMDRSAATWDAIHGDLPEQAQYAVSMAYRIRFVMQLNARAAMHLIELRSSAQGHPAYRAIAHELHQQIADVAGHKAIAEAMRFVDRSAVDLERLDAERRAERRRQASLAPRAEA